MSKYLISAVVSTYNSERFIRNRIENLLSQTIAKSLQIVIINSGSKQNELGIVQDYLIDGSDKIVYIETPERETIYKAWNRAVRKTNSKFITNANTDDVLRDDALEIFTNYLLKYDDVGLVYADQFITPVPNANFNTLEGCRKYIKPNFRKYLFLQRCIIGSQPVWKSDIHWKHGVFFDEKYEVAGDYEFEHRLIQYYKMKHISEVLGIYYKSPDNSNKEYENISRTFDETYNLMKKMNSSNINSLSKMRCFTLKISVQIITHLPFLIYRAIYKVIREYLPKFELNSLEYLFWLLSLVYELEGKIIDAKKICKRINSKSNSLLIQQRLQELKSLYDV